MSTFLPDRRLAHPLAALLALASAVVALPLAAQPDGFHRRRRRRGMQVDVRGNVYTTNVAFGERDGRALFITACEHVYRVRMNVAGVHPAGLRLP